MESSDERFECVSYNLTACHIAPLVGVLRLRRNPLLMAKMRKANVNRHFAGTLEAVIAS